MKMGFFNRLFGRGETRAAPADYLPMHFGLFGGMGYNDTGVSISEDNALICSTIFGCCTTIAQTISPLPIHVHNRQTKEVMRDHPLSALLSLAPNPYMTAVVFIETLLMQACLWGAGYAVIVRDELGYPAAFYPLESGRTKPLREHGQLLFETRVGNEPFKFTPDQIIHLLGWTTNGVSPTSPVKMARQAIGLAVAMERYSAKAFSGANVGGILQAPKMNDEAMSNFVSSWRKNYTGIDNSFRVAVLPDPWKFVQTSLDPEKAQMAEARRDQALEIARYYKVPPHAIGLLEKSSYASIEAQNLAFYQQTIQHWITKLEQELVLKCLLVREQSELEIKFLLDNLLRPATTERYSAYMTGRQGGWLSINDIRRKENMPPVEGGDVLMTPLNMTPVGTQPAGQPASRSLIEDAARRVLTKETKALTRAAKKFTGKPAELRAWADQFYKDHAALVVRAMAAPLKAAGLTVDVAGFANQHCADSVRAIVAGIESGQQADDLADEWLDIRPSEIADQLFKGGSNNGPAAA